MDLSTLPNYPDELRRSGSLDWILDPKFMETEKRYNIPPEELYKEISRFAPIIRNYHRLNFNSFDEIRKHCCMIPLCRNLFVTRYSWAIPCRESIQAIKEFAKNDTILEVGSGTGLWAYLLQCEKNVKIIATDSGIEKFATEYLSIEKIDMNEAVLKYDTNCLMVCWGRDYPKGFKGKKYIYIGEETGGATAGFPEEKDKWELVYDVELCKWHGLRDNLYLFQRT